MIIVHHQIIKVRINEIIQVHTPIIEDRNGRTFARVMINPNNSLNHIYIRANHTHLKIHAKNILSSLAFLYISSIETVQYCNKLIDVSVFVVYETNFSQFCCQIALISAG